MAGGLANGVLESLGGEKPSAPDFAAAINFDGDSNYPGGGTAAFQAFVRATLGLGAVEVLTVIDGGCGLYVPLYDKANDKLKAMVRTTGLEYAGGNISTTKFNVVVLCK